MLIEYSKCCNAEVTYEKGSYMGQWFAVCSRCGKYCEVEEK